MAKIPDVVQREFIPGYKPDHQGKVRDNIILEGNKLLTVASDRVSIFDFVLPGEVPQKGEVLTALNAFWVGEIPEQYPQDTVKFGSDIDQYLPPELRGNMNLHKRATVVKKLNMLPVEAIVRGYLTGSGYAAYEKTAPDHTVCGHRLPPGLNDGDRLPEPIFTPTDKATEGHDEHILADDVRARFGPQIENDALEIFKIVGDLASTRGIIIADTKFEFGINPETGYLTLGDERLTPDSSRFWLRSDWERSREKGTSPTSFDKQFVRNWGKTVGVDKRDPRSPEDVAYVHGLTIPQDVLLRTTRIYRYIFYLLTRMRLEVFQHEYMGIPTEFPPVEVVIGSESDLDQIQSGLDELRQKGISFRVHVISCHRNPEELRQYARTVPLGTNVIIAGAGMAAALSGVLSSWLREFRKDFIPVIGVAFKGKDFTADDAARLSIEQLPGKSVMLDQEGKAYFGPEGFVAACRDAASREFLSPPLQTKEAKLNLITT